VVSPTDITENDLRDELLPTGWVDNKVCAIDDTWSGLRFVLRKELRRPGDRRRSSLRATCSAEGALAGMLDRRPPCGKQLLGFLVGDGATDDDVVAVGPVAGGDLVLGSQLQAVDDAKDLVEVATRRCRVVIIS